MERLTERKYGEIVSSKREKEPIQCSTFCNNCSQGTGNCNYVKEMVEKLAKYEDLEEQCIAENQCGIGELLMKWKAFFDDIAELYEYRKAEEQGLLLRLPCKVGDTVYVIPSQVNYDLNILSRYTENNRVYAQVVDSMRMWRNGKYCLSTCEGLRIVLSETLGETWFLTREEAENALAGLAKTSAFAEKGGA